MKKMITLMALSLSLGTYATEFAFNKCQEGDLSLLNVARSGVAGLEQVIQDELLAQDTTCTVQKPRYIHPMVCGTLIKQVDTFKVTKEDGAKFEVVVDSSYRSCLRAMILPRIVSFKYETAASK